MIAKTPIGRLVPGDEIFEKERGRVVLIGTVAAIEKKVERRSVTVSLVGGGGFSQNWAAKILVRRA